MEAGDGHVRRRGGCGEHHRCVDGVGRDAQAKVSGKGDTAFKKAGGVLWFNRAVKIVRKSAEGFWTRNGFCQSV